MHHIRPARPDDLAKIVEMFAPVIRAGETYALDRDLTDADLFAYWSAPEKVVHVCMLDGEVAGASYLRPNQGGGGRHVANAGFVTASRFSGRGVARALCKHALDAARNLGYRAMQFNFVVASNTRAIAVWESFGFATLARLPAAFHHPTRGFVDALVMFKELAGPAR